MLTLLKGCSIVGVVLGRVHEERNPSAIAKTLRSDGDVRCCKVRPHIHATYPLERAADALNEVISSASRQSCPVTANNPLR